MSGLSIFYFFFFFAAAFFFLGAAFFFAAMFFILKNVNNKSSTSLPKSIRVIFFLQTFFSRNLCITFSKKISEKYF